MSENCNVDEMMLHQGDRNGSAGASRPDATLQSLSVAALVAQRPLIAPFLEDRGIPANTQATLAEWIAAHNQRADPDEQLDDGELHRALEQFVERVEEVLFAGPMRVSELTVLPGTDKQGNPETFEPFTVRRGQTVCLVGPTGSGKSRLLADIEWMACGDTPTGRRILLDGMLPAASWRSNPACRLVAQLSQNMNFVIDMTVREFLEMHAESRMIAGAATVAERIRTAANELAGEAFSADAAVTSLSGGQSRALMIADTAILSPSPIVLIDEIENAGVDRKRALELLLSEEKIVLMATHDPILALLGDYRLVIANGGIQQVLPSCPTERRLLKDLERLDRRLLAMRSIIRSGGRLEAIPDG
jgi:ABC-type lipoprotein export system ATPase subunit